jgi:uncharacterized membrane protein
VAVPLAVLPAAAATWGVSPARIPLFQGAFLVLGLADPIAAWAGTRWGRRRLTAAATGAGTVAFLATAVLLLTGRLLAAGWGPGRAVATAVLASVAAATAEAVARGGWDNLFVVCAVLLTLVPVQEGGSTGVLAGSLLGGAAVAGLAGAAGALTRRAAGTAGLFAASLLGLGGLPWAVPGLAFFGLASALSYLPGGAAAPRRTVRQVMANGGVAWALLGSAALGPPGSPIRALCFAGFLGALAAAAADTWATELGIRYAGRPWSLRTGRRVPAGTSGAVSLVGTGGAALGAASVALAAGLVPAAGLTLRAGLGVVGAGLVGMAVDSGAGATVQAHYRAAEGRLVEAPPAPGAGPVWGWRGVDNDIVNLLGTAAGALAVMLLLGGP